MDLSNEVYDEIITNLECSTSISTLSSPSLQADTSNTQEKESSNKIEQVSNMYKELLIEPANITESSIETTGDNLNESNNNTIIEDSLKVSVFNL